MSTRAFKKRLAAIAAVVPRRTPKPILETIRLEVDGRGNGSFIATDLETYARIRAPILRASRRGAAQLPGQALLAVLAGARDRELQLDFDPEAFSLASGPDQPAFSLLVVGSRTRLALRTHRPEDFPLRGEGTLPGHHEVELRHLQRLVQTTCFATDPGHARYTLGGCWLGLGRESIDVVATDGRRLAHAWRTGVRVAGTPNAPLEHAPDDRSRALAPLAGGRALRILDGLLEELGSPYEKARIAWTEDGCLQVEAPGLTFVTRQLAGRFPEWSDVFPPPSPYRGHCSRSDRLLALLKQVKALAGRDRRALRLGLRLGTLTLTVCKADGEICRFETCCDYRSEPVSADFNLAHLSELLSVIRAEAIDLELNGPGVPAVIHAAGLRYCVMPIPASEAAAPKGPEEGIPDDEVSAPEIEEELATPEEPATHS